MSTISDMPIELIKIILSLSKDGYTFANRSMNVLRGGRKPITKNVILT